jgi:hypothetical protein
LVAIDLASGVQKPIAEFPYDVTRLALTPDGQTIGLLQSPYRGRGNGSALFTIRIDGHDRRQLASGLPVTTYLEWVADGRQLLLQQLAGDGRPSCELMVVSSTDGAAITSTILPRSCNEMAVSPDGAEIVVTEIAAGELWAIEGFGRGLQPVR